MKPKNKLLDSLAFRDPDTPGHAGDQLELCVQIRNVAMLEWDMLGLSNINKPRGLHPSALSRWKWLNPRDGRPVSGQRLQDLCQRLRRRLCGRRRRSSRWRDCLGEQREGEECPACPRSSHNVGKRMPFLPPMTGNGKRTNQP